MFINLFKELNKFYFCSTERLNTSMSIEPLLLQTCLITDKKHITE